MLKKQNKGFTVAELIIVIVVSSILLTPVIFSLGSFYQDTLSSINISTQDTEVKSALATISSDLKEVTGFRASLTIPTATPQPPLGSSNDATAGGNWSYCGTATTSTTCDGISTNTNYTSKRVLIAYVDATDGPTTSTNFNPVFLYPGSGAFNLSTATRATNAYIYFVAPDRSDSSINNLYRRTIMNVDPATDANISSSLYDCSVVGLNVNPSIATCGTPTTTLDAKNSCASTVVASNASSCASSDAVILRNVESLWVDYYDSTGQIIADDYTDNSTTAATVKSNIKNNAKSVQVTVTKKPSGASAKRSTASTRILINSYSSASASASTDPNFSSVVALLSGDGANGSTTITDSSPLAANWTGGPNAIISSAQSKFGGTSIQLNWGSSQLVPSADSSNFSFGTGDFTIEAWYNTSNGWGANYIFDFNIDGTASRPALLLDYTVLRYWINGTYVIESPAVVVGTWNHIAISRASGQTRMFLNGTQVGSTYIGSDNIVAPTSRPLFSSAGGVGYVGSYGWDGYLDDIRITKGVGRYTTNFTPPTSAFK